jgi:hypothetical protein
VGDVGTSGPAGAKRPYEPPRIESEKIFETTALACGKLPGQTHTCMTRPQNS